MTQPVETPLWSPTKSERDHCQMTAFAKALEQKYDNTFFV